jgi:hypothetical protein
MKYKVRWTECCEYEREVEADSREDAINKATSNCGTEKEFTGWQEWETDSIEVEEVK